MEWHHHFRKYLESRVSQLSAIFLLSRQSESDSQVPVVVWGSGNGTDPTFEVSPKTTLQSWKPPPSSSTSFPHPILASVSSPRSSSSSLPSLAETPSLQSGRLQSRIPRLSPEGAPRNLRASLSIRLLSFVAPFPLHLLVLSEGETTF